MLFRMIYDDKLAQAAYLIGCQGTGEAIVVDPQRDVDRYIEAAKANKLRIVAVAETHIHADFLSGARQLAEATGARVYVSDEGDADWKYSGSTGGGAAEVTPISFSRRATRFESGRFSSRFCTLPATRP